MPKHESRRKVSAIRPPLLVSLLCWAATDRPNKSSSSSIQIATSTPTFPGRSCPGRRSRLSEREGNFPPDLEMMGKKGESVDERTKRGEATTTDEGSMEEKFWSSLYYDDDYMTKKTGRESDQIRPCEKVL